MRKVEEHAAHLSVRFKNGHDHQAMAAGDVYERADPRKVVGRDHSFCLPGTNRCHRRVEHRRSFWHFREVLEDRHAEDAIKSWLPSTDAVAKLSPWPPRALVAYEPCIGSEGLGGVAAKVLAKRS